MAGPEDEDGRNRWEEFNQREDRKEEARELDQNEADLHRDLEEFDSMSEEQIYDILKNRDEK